MVQKAALIANAITIPVIQMDPHCGCFKLTAALPGQPIVAFLFRSFGAILRRWSLTPAGSRTRCSACSTGSGSAYPASCVSSWVAVLQSQPSALSQPNAQRDNFAECGKLTNVYEPLPVAKCLLRGIGT